MSDEKSSAEDLKRRIEEAERKLDSVSTAILALYGVANTARRATPPDDRGDYDFFMTKINQMVEDLFPDIKAKSDG